MNYYYLSSTIIACENFLPSYALNEIKIELLNNRAMFGLSEWNSGFEAYSSACGGEDYWINNHPSYKKAKDTNEKIVKLCDWFLHQGLKFFAGQKTSVFNLLERKFEFDVHVISYNHGGYYNWHRDGKGSNLFTFNLILNEGNQLKGGEMLFMDDNKIIKVPNKNNFMVVFPSYISHAIMPLYSEDKKDVAFAAQRFSIQHWNRLCPNTN